MRDDGAIMRRDELPSCQNLVIETGELLELGVVALAAELVRPGPLGGEQSAQQDRIFGWLDPLAMVAAPPALPTRTTTSQRQNARQRVGRSITGRGFNLLQAAARDSRGALDSDAIGDVRALLRSADRDN
jgi:hypothetical protein